MRSLVLGIVLVAGCGRVGFDGLPDAELPPTFVTETLVGFTTTPFTVYDAYAVDATTLYAATQNGLARSTGDGVWTKDPFTDYPIFGVFPAGTDTYIVGGRDVINDPICARVTPTSVDRESSGLTEALNDGWAASQNDVYIAAYAGNLLHSTGAANWTVQPTGTTERLVQLWGSSANDIYVVGSAGTILHSTGDGTWSPQASGVTDRLLEVNGDRADNIYAVGYGGVILHSTGDGTWTREDSGVTEDLLALGHDDRYWYAGGRASTLLRSTGDGVWTRVELPVEFVQVDAIVPDGRGGMLLTGEPARIVRMQ